MRDRTSATRDFSGRIEDRAGGRIDDRRDVRPDGRDGDRRGDVAGDRDRDRNREGDRNRDGDWNRDRDRDHDHAHHDHDRDNWRGRRYFFRPGFGWWYWRWNPLVGRYYQFYDRNYYGSTYPSYGYDSQTYVYENVEPAALGLTFNQSLSGGAYVLEVLPGSPAAQAGMLPGDVIVSINGGAVSSHQEVIALVAQSRPGDPMRIDFLRGGQTMSVDVYLAARSAVFG